MPQLTTPPASIPLGNAGCGKMVPTYVNVQTNDGLDNSGGPVGPRELKSRRDVRLARLTPSLLWSEGHVGHDAKMVRGIGIPRLDVEHAVFTDNPVSTTEDLVEIAETDSVEMIGRERR